VNDKLLAARPPGVQQAGCTAASFTLHGAGIAGGIAIGRAHLISTARFEVARLEVAAERVEEEVRRLEDASAQVRGELIGLRASVPASAPQEMSAFLDLHLMILSDPHLTEAPAKLIRSRLLNAEWALIQQMESLVAQFEEIEDPYLRERKHDIVQVVERMLKAMPGMEKDPPRIIHEEDMIVVAHDLSPADMALFREHHFAGFATDLGGATSHTAIVARSLNIPAIVGLHHARALVREGELLIIDGREGVLIVNPDERVLSEYQQRRGRLELERRGLRSLRLTPAATLDGVAVELHANIEFPQDVEAVREAGAAGIGLFRSEFLFLNRKDLPGEDEQFEAYRKVVQAMEGLPVTIRSLDLGADKAVHGAHSTSPNPALGLRAIRYCMAEPQMFHTQLRAILRASHYGPIRLLIPMLAHPHEVEHTLAAVAQAKATLAAEGVGFDPGIGIGGMVEVPGIALALGYFVEKLDFLSIGTNDLIQYTLAIDRSDDEVAHLYDPFHPAVLHLIALTIRTAQKAGRPVAVCGEMAGDPAATRLLLGLGLREFSMQSAHLLEVKQQVLRSRFKDAQAIAARILRTHDPQKRSRLLGQLNE
jgi:phosphotransferase system enzyme I (PtsI)